MDGEPVPGQDAETSKPAEIKVVDQATLSKRYDDGELDGVLNSVRNLSGANGGWMAAEMQIALSKYAINPSSLSPEDKRRLDQLGRLAAKEDDFIKSAENFKTYKVGQEAAAELQAKLDAEGKDPYSFQFDPRVLENTMGFERESARIYTKFENLTIGEHERSDYEKDMKHQAEVNAYAAEVDTERVHEEERRLDELLKSGRASQYDIDVRKSMIDHYKGLVNQWKSWRPEGLEDYWKGRFRQSRLSQLASASDRSYIPNGSQLTDYRNRYRYLHNSPLPEDQRVFYDAKVNPRTTLTALEKFYEEPFPQIRLRVKTKLAMDAGDPRFTSIDHFNGMQVTGKVKRLLEAYEQVKKAGLEIELPMQLLTDAEKKQVDRYFQPKEEPLAA